MNIYLFLLTLSAHVREGYSSLFVIHSFIVLTADFYSLREEELQLDDNLSPFNLPFF